VAKRKAGRVAPGTSPDRRAERKRDLIAAAALAILVLLFWWRVVLLRGFLFHDDMSRQNLPWAAVYGRALSHGHLPLWAPDMWCGFPLFAEGQVGALYPPNVLLSLILPYDTAVHYGLILHYILAAVFAFWLAREMGFTRPAALLAGGVLALSGMMVVHAIHVNMIRTLAWLPLLLVIVVRAVQRGQPLRSVPALAIVFAMQVLAGFPPVLFLSAATVVLVAAALPAPNAAWSPIFALRMVGFCVAGGALGAALAAVQLWPTLELASLSARAEQRSPFEFLTWGQMPLQFMPTLILPHLMGSVENRTFIGMPWQFHEWCAYVGILPLVLAAAGWRSLAGGWRRAVAVLVIVGLTLAVAKWPYHIIAHLPGANLFRLPTRWLLLFDVGVIIAAGAGLGALFRGEKKALRRTAAWCALAGAILAALGLAGLAAKNAGLQWEIGGYAGARTRDLLQYFREPEPWLLASLLLVSGGLSWLAARGRLRPHVAAAAVAALCILDLCRFGYDFNPLVPPDRLRRRPPAAGALRRDGMKGRAFQPDLINPLISAGFRTRSWDSIRERIALLMPNHNMLWRTPNVAGYSPMETQQHVAMRNAFTYCWARKSNRIFAISSTAYIIESAPGRAVGTSAAWPAVRITRVPDFLPRAYLAGAALRANGVYQAVGRALSPSFDPRTMVVLEGAPDVPLASPGKLPGAFARIARETDTRVEIECRAPRAAMLVLADMFYPGWTAAVDGRPAPIYRANGVFRAVAVEQGAHRVIFSFRPASLRGGAVVSLVGIAALLVIAALTLRPRPLLTR